MASLAGLLALLVIIVPIVLLIVFIGKVNALSSRVRQLEFELLRMHSASARATGSEAATPMSPPVDPARPVLQTPQPLEEVASPQASPTPLPIPEAKSRSQAREEWESFVGGKLLNRIGALALTIGVGFFLKYAFDNDWISETLRVLLGAIAGVAFLLLGGRFHRKEYHVFAQGLVGAGIAILYLSVFASFNFYHIVSQTTAFALMSVVTLIAFYQAFRYDALAIAILAWAGGYLTPLMLSTGVSNEVGLFLYIDLLEAGLLGVVIVRQSWVILELLTLAGTYFIFGAWHTRYYSPEALLVTVLFLTLFWLLFYISDIYRSMTKAPPHPLRQVVALLNVAIYYAYLYALVNEDHHEVMGLLTLVLACLYVLPAYVTHRIDPQSPMLRGYILTAAAMLIVATAIQCSGFTTVVLWSCEAIALIWFAQRWGYRYLVGATLLLYVIILGKLLFTGNAFVWVPVEEFTPVLNMRVLAFVALAVSMGFSAYILATIEIAGLQTFRTLLHAGWCILLFSLITSETVDLFTHALEGDAVPQYENTAFMRNMTLLCVWTLYSLPLVYGGLRRITPTIAMFGLVLVGMIFVFSAWWGISYSPIQDFHVLFNIRALGLVFVLAGSVMAARWLHDARDTLELARKVYPVLLIGQVALLLLLCTAETRDFFERKLYLLSRENTATAELRSSIENMKQLSLSALWLVYGIALMLAGIWRRIRGLRILGILVLGVAILKIFIYDLSFLDTLYRIFSFMGLGLILLAASYAYQRYKDLIFGESGRGQP